MLTQRELLRHSWDSSRRKDENFLLFGVFDDSVSIGYSCLWDADEGTVDDGEVTLSISALVLVIQQLRDNQAFSSLIPGTEEKTHVRFTRNGAQVHVDCNWGQAGAGVLVPLEKIVALLDHDEIIARINSPLEIPPSDGASYTCDCGAPMVQDDGSEGYRCSDGCLG